MSMAGRRSGKRVMGENKLRVAAYCRVSTDKEDQANSLISQKSYFAEYIRRQTGWVLSKVYADDGYSGTQTKKRVGFNAMIEDAMRGQIDLILTKEVCRFARNTVDTLFYTRKLKEKGVGVIFTIDHIDTRDSDGELRLTLMASIAQEESRKTSERVKWGQKRRMEQGVVFGGDLLGYTVSGGVLSINEEEARIVRAIFHKYTNEGKGVHVIAKELTEEGMYPKRGQIWSDTAISRVLHNEKYVGDLCQKKTCTPDYLTHVKKCNKDREQMIYLKDHHEPLIDRGLWERAQEVLAKRSASMEKRLKFSGRYWCSGKICCGLCGKRYVSRTKRLKNGALYKAWRCHTSASCGAVRTWENGKKTGCDNQSVNERVLLACVYFCINQLSIDREYIRREVLRDVKALEDKLYQHTDVENLREKIEALMIKKRKSIDLMLEGLITQKDLKEQTKWYGRQEEILTRQLAYAEQTEFISKRRVDLLEQNVELMDEIMTFDERNVELYNEALERIIIFPENRIEIKMKTLPIAFLLTYGVQGRAENYTVKILKMETTEIGAKAL